MKHPLWILFLLATPAWAQVCPDLTTLQRAAGFVTWRHLLQAGGIALAAAGTLYFAWGLVRLLMLRLRLVQALLWLLAVAGVGAGALVPADHRVWPVLFGALLLPGAAALSLRLRGIAFRPQRHLAALATAWAVIATAYQLQSVGFLAVGALLAQLGCFIAVGPLCYWFGFRDRDALVRASLAGALVAVAFALLSGARVPLGPLEVFRAGALWLGAFAWYLGVLIAASKWYPGSSYAARQALALVSIGGSLSFGLLAAVGEITTMAGTFLIFYLLGKLAEVPARGRIALGLKLLAAGGLLSVAWYAAGP